VGPLRGVEDGKVGWTTQKMRMMNCHVWPSTPPSQVMTRGGVLRVLDGKESRTVEREGLLAVHP
jgi:hypothetical protein